MRELRTPENIRGPNLLAQLVKRQRTDNRTSLPRRSGDPMRECLVPRREDYMN